MHKAAPVVQRVSLLTRLADEPIQFVAELLHCGSTIGLPPIDRSVIRKLNAATRAARHRAQKNTEEFRAAEAQRKRERRAGIKEETERVAAVDDVLKENPNPLLILTDAPQGKGVLVTGGYGAQKTEKVLAASGARSSNGSLGSEDDTERSEGRLVKPSGRGLKDHEDSQVPPQQENQFIQKAFLRFKLPREVKMLHQFIYDNTYTNSAKAIACLVCRAELCPKTEFSEHVEHSFYHFAAAHPVALQNLMDRVAKTAACPEDHERYIRLFSGGEQPLVCRKCKKTLWKPPKGRTDADDGSKS
jgi:hypothetical protein